MSEIKFTEEELQSLSDLSKKYQDIQLLMGQVSVQKLVNTQRAEKIEENELWDNIEDKEKDQFDEIPWDDKKDESNIVENEYK